MRASDFQPVRNIVYAMVYLGLIVILGTLLAEVGLRITTWAKSSLSHPGTGFTKVVQERIFKEWTRAVKEPFHPPFTVYINENFSDQRLAEIAKDVYLPSNREWIVENFLLPESERPKFKFKVRTNQFGIRGPDFLDLKRTDVVRIMALGSYPTFGHGVNDDETYPAVLQELLNKKNHSPQKNVEVWNFGRQGATAIMGLAALKGNILRLRPNVILWDFGWIDLFLKRWDIARHSGENFPADSLAWTLSRRCYQYPLNRLALCSLLINKISFLPIKKTLEGWRLATEQAIQVAHEFGIPIIVMRHPDVLIESKRFKDFDRPAEGSFFLDTSQSIESYPWTANERAAFLAQAGGWLNELGINKENLEQHKDAFFKVDAVQYNARAQAIIAKDVFAMIQNLNLLN